MRGRGSARREGGMKEGRKGERKGNGRGGAWREGPFSHGDGVRDGQELHPGLEGVPGARLRQHRLRGDDVVEALQRR